MNRLSVKHTHAAEGFAVTTTYHQVGENSISARVRIRDTGSSAVASANANVSIVVQLDTGAKKGTKSSPAVIYAAKVSHPSSTMVLIEADGGPSPSEWAVALVASEGTARMSSTNFFDSEDALRAGLSAAHRTPSMANYTTSSSLLFMSANLVLQKGAHDLDVVLSRSAPQPCDGGPNMGCRSPPASSAFSSLAVANALGVISDKELENQYNRVTAEDEHFWKTALKLEGSWPDAWKRGVQYDFGTVRANIRPAVGVFKHPWDAMQVGVNGFRWRWV
jgi:hypothetical protein